MSSQQKCAMPSCDRPARYLQGWADSSGVTRWGEVCSTHDRHLGRKNLAAAYGLTRQEAVDMDQRLQKEAEA